MDNPMVPANKRFEVDEYGIKNDGEMLASPLESLEPGFIDFARLQAGASFGMEMMEHGKPAVGKIVALKRTHMLTLSAAEYEKAKEFIKKYQESQKRLYLGEIVLFRGFTNPMKSKLIRNSKFVRVIKDSIVQEEGNPVDRVYIIRSGDFQVTQMLMEAPSTQVGKSMTG